MIRDNSDPSQWHYVDTAENPADHASRGLCASGIHSTNWLRGPKLRHAIRVEPDFMELRVNGFWVIGGSKLVAKIIHTYSFINSLRCFISLRGAVQQLHCDQGSNFVGARNELKEALKQCDTKLLEIFLTEKQCKFCPGRLDDASLRTLLYEAMAVVNSRALNSGWNQ
ncbi:hypothetical protein FQN60_010712 [Etheostoma spectabile]|uniref:Integrase catalytic domain-containing protein n=1 Tax=Etheostoma spectabile TaxID=54343 RepID=A0A5J5C7N0_9PERO|nr:hypothetical protein FQN60_010712 [Etheostoma spectabile]